MKQLLVALAVLCLPLAALAQVNTLPSVPHLLVTGHAEANVVPDRFTIHLNVDVTNLVPDVARRKVEAHMDELFKALDANGALKDRTRASSLSIQPETKYENDKEVFKGTEVSRWIDATFDSLDKLRAFIASVPANEEVQIGSVKTARSDMDAISSRLRAAAIENSKAAAAKIAADYGMKIIGIYAVSEVAPDFAYGIKAGSWGGPQTLQTIVVTGSRMPGAPPPPPGAAMRVGTMNVGQDIYAVYLIAPK